MNKKKIIQSAIQFAKASLEREGTGHDFWHIVRVRNNAQTIWKTEGGDWFVIELAILLHDVGDRKVIQKAEDDYTIAERFLLENEVNQKILEHVMYIITHMSFSKLLDTKDIQKTKEFEIVQDADRLDALGAIGIARLFTFGGSKGSPIHVPVKPIQKFTSQEEYKKMCAQKNYSSFEHFSHKILSLKEYMNTKTAKKIAQKRHTYVERYMKQFLEEWDGKR